MRVPVGWLRAYCDPGLPAEEIADVLTMAGGSTGPAWGTPPRS